MADDLNAVLQDRIDRTRATTLRLTAVLVATLVLAYAMLVVYTGFRLREDLLAQSRAYLDLIVSMRVWNAGHEGVWVVKRPGVDTNPYLEGIVEHPDLESVDGRVLTLRNPAAMTREVSEIVDARDGVSFRLVSERPLNPGNAPDAWEREALAAFEEGAEEHSALADGDALAFRYMRPLATEQACLTCHAGQGYSVGDVRGGLSVTVPIEPYMAGFARDALVGGLVVAFLAGLSITGARVVLRRYTEEVTANASRLERIATTDYLTGLGNRRAAMDRLRSEVERAQRTGRMLSVMISDIDHFKRVNDAFGHGAGDDVLRTVADAITASVRSYDHVMRFGGEEFLVISPETGAAEAVEIAERIRLAVAAARTSSEKGALSVTLSAGVSELAPGDDADRLLSRADDALYAAKEAGRDRVVRAD
ncbi:MAG: diguanylate cyclase [Anaerosomatales bacterium]|nr:diguanylate cyclase [Anaerosomatales bacterium]